MERIKVLNNALALIKEMYTVWDDYDFREVSTEPQKRVPKMVFCKEAIVISDEVRRVLNFCKEAFVREVRVNYKDCDYVVVLSADTYAGFLTGMHIEVYTPKGEGMNAMYQLVTADL